MAKSSSQRSGYLWITLIGIFKLAKAVSLLVIAFGLLHLVHRDVAATVERWVERFRLDPDNRYIHHILSRVLRVTPRQLKELSVGSFIYAGVFLTEGIGLLMRRHWAEYLTIVSTALFIPLEIYEIVERFTLVRLSVTLINVAIVWYLILHVKQKK